MGRITTRWPVTRISLGSPATRRPDLLAVEEPLEIRVGGTALAVTMRTPGNDIELAAGFLVSEGVVAAPDDIRSAILCGDDAPGGDVSEPNSYNVIDVSLSDGVTPPGAEAARSFFTTSSCGICGKASIDAVETVSSFVVSDDDVMIDASSLAALPERLRGGQRAFDRTGGLHAAALFDVDSGELLVLREDVGRHNAVDKVIGWALTHGRLPLRRTVLQVSGRASFELVQKAVMAGVPILAAVSAPSSLAAELASSTGLTLVGFLRGASMNVYARPDRVVHAVT